MYFQGLLTMTATNMFGSWYLSDYQSEDYQPVDVHPDAAVSSIVKATRKIPIVI